MRLQFDDSQIKGLAALWKRAPEIMTEEMLVSIVQYNDLVWGQLREQLPRGAGGLNGAGIVGSVTSEIEQLSDNVIGVVGTDLPYAEYVELGTAPHFPPIQPLEDWVQAKLGIDDEQERRSVAFLIARKIAVKGTKADGTWSRVAEATAGDGERFIGDGIDRALDRLGAPA